MFEVKSRLVKETAFYLMEVKVLLLLIFFYYQVRNLWAALRTCKKSSDQQDGCSHNVFHVVSEFYIVPGVLLLNLYSGFFFA